jgi:hypothetical protein
LKKATLTPNRFIISTRSWPVKGLALFLILLALGSCEDEIGLIGTNSRTSRFGVYFKEFDIPVTTVQTDSLRSSIVIGERLLVGVANDPNFGKVSANLYAQFTPASYTSPKIDKTGKTDFKVQSITVNFVLSSNYYIYGDTSNTTETFSLHQITDNEFKNTKDYFTNTSVSFDASPLVTTTFSYLHDSIIDHRKKNSDSNTANNRYDTISFNLPLVVGQHLLDTALANGVKTFNTEKGWTLSPAKTDSVFRIKFPGFALIPSGSNTKILGIKTLLSSFSSSTVITLNYSYVQQGNTVKAKYYYPCQIGPAFSSHNVDRTGTALMDINAADPTDKHVDFNVSDDYAYLQSGTGLFARLDFSQVHSYFDANPDTIINVAINAAELVIDLEPKVVRQHISMPSALLLRAVGSTNGFFRVPQIEVVENSLTYVINDPQYAANYFCINNGLYLDGRADNNSGTAEQLRIPLTKETVSRSAYYSIYMSDFMQYFLRVPSSFRKLYSVALLPADAGYGKSFEGLSFKKDKVKLRIYYTKTL